MNIIFVWIQIAVTQIKILFKSVLGSIMFYQFMMTLLMAAIIINLLDLFCFISNLFIYFVISSLNFYQVCRNPEVLCTVVYRPSLKKYVYTLI